EEMFRGSSVVEQPAVNRLVVGSNPTRGAIYTRRAEPLAWAAGAGKWRSMKRRGLVAKLTNHFANDQIIALARFRDANLPNCPHRYTVKRPKIAHDSTTIPGLGFNTRGRAISPRTFTRTWIFLGGSFFRPLERRPYHLTRLGSKRTQGTAPVHREG